MTPFLSLLWAAASFAPIGVPEGCPCQPNDWMCRDQHPVCSGRPEPEPEPEPEPVDEDTPATEDTPAQLEALDDEAAVTTPVSAPNAAPPPAERPDWERSSDPPPPAAPKNAPWERTGPMLSADLGIANCTGPQCSLIAVAGSTRLSLGYRHQRFAVVMSGAVGGANIKVEDLSDETQIAAPPDSEGHIRFFGFDVGAQFLPITDRRFDPFLLAAIGYSGLVLFARNGGDDIEYEFRTKRAAIRLATGWPFYVTPNLSMGPRIDATLTFAGKVCERLTIRDSGDEDCESVNKLSEGLSKADKRLLRRDLPKPWSATWEVRYVF